MPTRSAPDANAASAAAARTRLARDIMSSLLDAVLFARLYHRLVGVNPCGSASERGGDAVAPGEVEQLLSGRLAEALHLADEDEMVAAVIAVACAALEPGDAAL